MLPVPALTAQLAAAASWPSRRGIDVAVLAFTAVVTALAAAEKSTVLPVPG